MIQIGILGCGGVAYAHAKAITHFPNQAKLVAVADTNEARLKRFSDQHNVQSYSDAADLLNQPDIDCIIIALPTFLHAEWAIRAAKAGKSILLEKPMAVTLEACDEIIDVATTNNVFLSVGHSYRYYDGPWAIKLMLTQAELGHMVFAVATFSKNWKGAQRVPWANERDRGGGMWLMNGSHTVNTLRWLTDSPVVAVKGLTGRCFHPWAEVQADDATIALLQHQNGVHTVAVVKGYRRGAPKDMLEITCTEGMIRCERSRLWIGLDEQWQERSIVTENNKVRQLNEFLTRLEKGDEPAIPAEEARETVRILLAVEESSATGREVRLD